MSRMWSCCVSRLSGGDQKTIRREGVSNRSRGFQNLGGIRVNLVKSHVDCYELLGAPIV